MKKILYTGPAVIVCMLYGLLAALAGGIRGFQIVAWLYIAIPILSAVLLNRGKWWGCLPGIAMGGYMAFTAWTGASQVVAMFAAGLVLAAYYAAMGLVCAVSRKK